MSNLNLVIKSLRKARGITQKELALKADVSLSYLKAVEAGRKNPSIKTLARFANSLDLSIKEIAQTQFREKG